MKGTKPALVDQWGWVRVQDSGISREPSDVAGVYRSVGGNGGRRLSRTKINEPSTDKKRHRNTMTHRHTSYLERLTVADLAGGLTAKLYAGSDTG